MRKILPVFCLLFCFWITELAAQLPAPSLVSPGTFSNGIPLNGQIFDWSDVNGAVKYEFQYSTDFSFTTNVTSSFNTISQDTAFNLQAATQYFWQARAFDANDSAGAWSFAWVFNTTGNPIPAPTLLLPLNNDTGQVYTNLLLDWKDVPSAVAYEIWYARDNNFNQGLVIDTVNTVSQYTIPNLWANTIYFWKVSATSGPSTSAFSSTWRFQTRDTVINIARDPALNQPQLQLYPTLNQGVFTVEMNLNSPENLSLKVISIDGKEVWKKDISTQTIREKISLSGLKAGVYFLVVEGENFRRTGKVIISF
ncbi:MAG: T9SS type A sorting domain-containing protein [Bacteroidia bacterium]|nr:T9SS type A sorting domain-containing protein [Bacteroidia bacterium]